MEKLGEIVVELYLEWARISKDAPSDFLTFVVDLRTVCDMFLQNQDDD